MLTFTKVGLGLWNGNTQFLSRLRVRPHSKVLVPYKLLRLYERSEPTNISKAGYRTRKLNLNLPQFRACYD